MRRSPKRFGLLSRTKQNYQSGDLSPHSKADARTHLVLPGAGTLGYTKADLCCLVTVQDGPAVPRRLMMVVLPALLPALLAGCEDAPPAPPAPPAAPAAGGTRFDPARCGTVQGLVRWRGPLPPAPSFRSFPQPLNEPAGQAVLDWPNPHTLSVHPATYGVGWAVVYLIGVDPQAAPPWDLPPVRVEIADQRFTVVQGDRRGRCGFLRPGEAFELESRDKLFHSVQARGSAFFTCPMPADVKLRTRQAQGPGIIELRSGCGYFWMRAYLLVTPHPCATLTDHQGRFVLRNVPAGDYELVAWVPNPQVRHRERNPENTRVQQVQFGPPLECRKRVRVGAGAAAVVGLELSR
jgi:hypothetical protein